MAQVEVKAFHQEEDLGDHNHRQAHLEHLGFACSILWPWVQLVEPEKDVLVMAERPAQHHVP
jgi:hypothetical protein